MKAPRFPVTIRRGSVATKVYRLRRGDGREVYTAAWHAGGVRFTRQFPSYVEAHAEASLKADQLAAGRISAAATVTADDASTLAEAKKLCDGVPLLAALQEWSKARRLCGGPIIPAAEQWADRNRKTLKRMKVADAVDAFIRAKERAGKQGERTYRAKLDPLKAFFPDAYIDAITSTQLAAYLEQWQDGVTRNDLRKRAVALWRWCQKSGYIARGTQLEIEHTERAHEEATEIGTITPETYRKLLEFIRSDHPEHLAALVLAGFCGIRSDEIHGKRADRSKRQLWEDIDLAQKHLNVTVAKKNTPAWRLVTLCDAAIEWLMLCPDRKGPVCQPGAMEKVRALAIAAGFALPENCFRHSAISYKIAVTGDKAATATWAGNSVAEIDRRYRRPMPKAAGEAWFGIRPVATVGEVVAYA